LFSDRVSHCCLGLASDHDLPTSASHIVGITGLCHYSWPFLRHSFIIYHFYQKLIRKYVYLRVEKSGRGIKK
jgi:hypothetical protein